MMIRWNDQEVLKKEIFSLNILELDSRVEVPVLVDIGSTRSDEFEREAVAGLVGLLTAVGQLNGVPGEVFLPATTAFQLRFRAAQGEEKRTWGKLVILLNAAFGFQPDPEILALTFDLTNDKDIGVQGSAFKAIARLRPLSAQAKELFRARVIQRAHQVSGADLSPTLVNALPDSDVVQRFVTAAQSNNLQQQRIATQVLSGMSPLPQPAVDLFAASSAGRISIQRSPRT